MLPSMTVHFNDKILRPQSNSQLEATIRHVQCSEVPPSLRHEPSDDAVCFFYVQTMRYARDLPCELILMSSRHTFLFGKSKRDNTQPPDLHAFPATPHVPISRGLGNLPGQGFGCAQPHLFPAFPSKTVRLLLRLFHSSHGDSSADTALALGAAKTSSFRPKTWHFEPIEKIVFLRKAGNTVAMPEVARPGIHRKSKYRCTLHLCSYELPSTLQYCVLLCCNIYSFSSFV